MVKLLFLLIPELIWIWVLQWLVPPAVLLVCIAAVVESIHKTIKSNHDENERQGWWARWQDVAAVAALAGFVLAIVGAVLFWVLPPWKEGAIVRKMNRDAILKQMEPATIQAQIENSRQAYQKAQENANEIARKDAEAITQVILNMGMWGKFTTAWTSSKQVLFEGKTYDTEYTIVVIDDGRFPAELVKLYQKVRELELNTKVEWPDTLRKRRRF